MNDDLKQVIDSFHRARNNGDLFTTFYQAFFTKSPGIPPMFARTDFDRQKRMLRQSLLELLNYAAGIQTAIEEATQLGRMHAKLDIKPVHFTWWMDSLLEALEKHDPQFSTELSTLWRQALQPGINAMLQEMPQAAGEDPE